MSSVPLVFEDGCACGPELMRIIDGGHSLDTDRRRRVRVALALTVYLLRSNDVYPIESKTKNVSSEGFYCFVPEPFAIDECIRCILVVPAFDPEHPNHAVSLECQARVLRVEPVGTGKYGIACRIENYKVVPHTSRTETTRTMLTAS